MTEALAEATLLLGSMVVQLHAARQGYCSAGQSQSAAKAKAASILRHMQTIDGAVVSWGPHAYVTIIAFSWHADL